MKQINHTGRDRCRRVTFGLWRALGSRQESAPTLADWANTLGVDPAEEMEILSRCRHLAGHVEPLQALPHVTPVVLDATGEPVPGLTDSLEATAAVLARCSAQLFLRRKSPVAIPLYLLRSVTLILPCDWSPTP